VRYLTELNEWLGRDLRDRQSEFRGIGSRIDMLNTLIDGFIHQTSQLCQTAAGIHVYSFLLDPTFPAVHNGQALIEAPQSQDTIHGDMIPQIAISDVPRSMTSVTRTTEVSPQFMPPVTTSLSRGVVDSTSHNPTPSSIDILADTARVAMGSPTLSLPAQGESETPPAETSSPTLLIVNLTDRDTIKATSSSDATPFQPSRLTSAPSPALAVLTDTMDPPLSFDVPHATGSAPASSVGSLDNGNDYSTLPSEHSLHSVDTFPGNRNTIQNSMNTPFSPQVTPIDFTEPSHFVNGSVHTPVQCPIPLSPDIRPYPRLTTAGRLTPQSMYLNQADSFPIAPVEVPLVALESSCTIHVPTPQDPNCHSVWLYPTKSQEPSVHDNGIIPEPVMKRPLPQPVSFQWNQGESWLAPPTVLRPDDSISNAPFVPMRNASGSRTLDEKFRVVSAPLQKLPSPNLTHVTSPLTPQQGINAGTTPDIPVASPTHDRVQDVLASVHKSLAAQEQDREYYIQQVAQIAQHNGALLEEERKKVRELEETLQRLTIEAGEERRGLIWGMQMKCEEARLAAEANHGLLLSNFKEFANRIDASLQEGAAQRQMITGHLSSKEQKRVEKDNRWAALENTLRKVVEEDATERLRAQKQQEEEALRPGDITHFYLKYYSRADSRLGAEQVIEELRGHNIEHQRLLTDFMNGGYSFHPY
jgi:hypothetical protein